jgi:hypothetical protein
MQMLNINEVCELVNVTDVNRYLCAGWLLLNTVAKRDANGGWMVYSLGWEHDLPAWRPNH